MLLNYGINARDSSTIPPGVRLTGLKPTWMFLQRLDTGAAITPLPVITEIQGGQYKFPFNPITSGEASGQIDLGATVAWPCDRYIDVWMYASDSNTAALQYVASGQVVLKQG